MLYDMDLGKSNFCPSLLRISIFKVPPITRPAEKCNLTSSSIFTRKSDLSTRDLDLRVYFKRRIQVGFFIKKVD